MRTENIDLEREQYRIVVEFLVLREFRRLLEREFFSGESHKIIRCVRATRLPPREKEKKGISQRFHGGSTDKGLFGYGDCRERAVRARSECVPRGGGSFHHKREKKTIKTSAPYTVHLL